MEEPSRRPKNCPWQTEPGVVAEIMELRKKHPSWGPQKILDVLGRRDPERGLPSIPTTARILDRAGLVKPRRPSHKPAVCKLSSGSLMIFGKNSTRFVRMKRLG
jgi:hypothetical protein